MTRSAPKTPRPIRDDPKVGQYQVVASFRLRGPLRQPTFAAEAFRETLRAWAETYSDGLADLDVAVRAIGAGGERSEHEGTVGL
jgi:hypothetical protein